MSVFSFKPERADYICSQVESIFLSSIGSYGSDICKESLNKLIQSETTIFDVLPDFFYHKNSVVRMAAFEVGDVIKVKLWDV